ncbi:hypothetical protein BU23DRAFT_601883 [Bimuria novae-zelandiae CBS 107.79]|uniref:Uncharacterized protein n=1 Tax=Bimuria novae-zelandiae CBS 107.79 TaxID=1447943 RepID=A0A6A5UWI4_9PLEO|nr:hypothetical protein BU23DRAFT_601883 [Bimuria novae-zelandiae CBS 107.79]
MPPWRKAKNKIDAVHAFSLDRRGTQREDTRFHPQPQSDDAPPPGVLGNIQQRFGQSIGYFEGHPQSPAASFRADVGHSLQQQHSPPQQYGSPPAQYSPTLSHQQYQTPQQSLPRQYSLPQQYSPPQPPPIQYSPSQQYSHLHHSAPAANYSVAPSQPGYQAQQYDHSPYQEPAQSYPPTSNYTSEHQSRALDDYARGLNVYVDPDAYTSHNPPPRVPTPQRRETTHGQAYQQQYDSSPMPGFIPRSMTVPTLSNGHDCSQYISRSVRPESDGEA